MARCGFPRQRSAVGGGSQGRGVWAWASVVTTAASAPLPSQATQGQGFLLRVSGTRELRLGFSFSVLRYNSHNIKFIMLKCTIQWILVHLLCCATFTTT